MYNILCFRLPVHIVDCYSQYKRINYRIFLPHISVNAVFFLPKECSICELHSRHRGSNKNPWWRKWCILFDGCCVNSNSNDAVCYRFLVSVPESYSSQAQRIIKNCSNQLFVTDCFVFPAIPTMDPRKYSILHYIVAYCHIKIYILVECTSYDSVHCSRLAFLSKFCNVSITKTEILRSCCYSNRMCQYIVKRPMWSVTVFSIGISNFR